MECRGANVEPPNRLQVSGRNIGLAVAAIHQPGHSDISGVYFTTKDGKTYDCSAVNEYETEDHPGWEHYLYFLLAERAKPLNDNEQMYAVSAASRFAGPE